VVQPVKQATVPEKPRAEEVVDDEPEVVGSASDAPTHEEEIQRMRKDLDSVLTILKTLVPHGKSEPAITAPALIEPAPMGSASLVETASFTAPLRTEELSVLRFLMKWLGLLPLMRFLNLVPLMMLLGLLSLK